MPSQAETLCVRREVLKSFTLCAPSNEKKRCCQHTNCAKLVTKNTFTHLIV